MIFEYLSPLSGWNDHLLVRHNCCFASASYIRRLIFLVKGARSCYFRQFQHWSNCPRINLNIKITAQNYRRTRTKRRKDKKGHGWTKLERIEVDCIWINLKNVGPHFSNLRYVSLYMYQTFINTAGKSFSVVMWSWFCKWKTLGLPVWSLELYN